MLQGSIGAGAWDLGFSASCGLVREKKKKKAPGVHALSRGRRFAVVACKRGDIVLYFLVVGGVPAIELATAVVRVGDDWWCLSSLRWMHDS